MQKFRSVFLFVTVSLIFFNSQGFSQEAGKLKWSNPTDVNYQVVQGQGWFKDLEHPYDRLPAKAEKNVREAVWNNSTNSAGLNIRFTSNAAEIIVRYVVKGPHAMPHMPATGVSGIDLYSFNKDGVSEWARAEYKFGDTIVYRFKNLKLDDFYKKHGRLYQLYLPLYNRLEWIQIGIVDSSKLNFLPIRPEKPIVVYGTSIAQGGCASRPGMAWTAILERKLDQPLINLAFSGNGRLEKEVLDIITDIDARLIVLDCLPNLNNKVTFPPEDVKKRIVESVKKIRTKYPIVPILLAEHCGSTINQLNTLALNSTKEVNLILQEAFKQMQNSGEKNIHLLPATEIAFNADCTVDGTHPNDLGMQYYADAYEKAIRKILSEPIGSISTTIPCIQYRDASVYNWQERHRQALNLTKTNQPKTVFLGNSITHYWGGTPDAAIKRGNDSWDKYFKTRETINLGFGWDRIENVLWRIYHGELDGYKASDIVLLIGTNNLSVNTDEEIITGLSFLLNEIKLRQPEAKILLMGLLPRTNLEVRVAGLNEAILKLVDLHNVDYLRTDKLLVNSNGKINEIFFNKDGVHPNTEGYYLLAPLIHSKLSRK
ncbi:MAG: SGNH/GDSL hydrolase family protein [Sphingobacteriaceae bacterium]